MKSNLFTLLLIAGLLITGCDYFETNDDNTYLNKTGKVKIINELGYDATYIIYNSVTDSLVGTITNGTISESIDLNPGFKVIRFTEITSDVNPRSAIFNDNYGIQADKFHYIFAVNSVNIIDNFVSFSDTLAKVRILNASPTFQGSDTYISGQPINTTTDLKVFTNLTFPGFDISPVNIKTGNTNISQVLFAGGTIANQLNTTANLEGKSGYSILIKRNNTISVLNDTW